ncbi:uncharacterized protein LOC128209537 [Mya arenaria]|uniref:uncharacterized protein LOC128209537 n=1 Tax=Mya arenaria TaxID=6604 RepID=UPI0022E1A6D7|nr:uncharacterized protein LOC128209537 [Mya arenaria]
MDFNVLTCSCILVTGTVSLVCILVGLLCPSWTLVVIRYMFADNTDQFRFLDNSNEVYVQVGLHSKVECYVDQCLNLDFISSNVDQNLYSSSYVPGLDVQSLRVQYIPTLVLMVNATVFALAAQVASALHFRRCRTLKSDWGIAGTCASGIVFWIICCMLCICAIGITVVFNVRIQSLIDQRDPTTNAAKKTSLSMQPPWGLVVTGIGGALAGINGFTMALKLLLNLGNITTSEENHTLVRSMVV